jgi:8-oxo-dGTP pyrophosphatase MutT (NUDIX family)
MSSVVPKSLAGLVGTRRLPDGFAERARLFTSGERQAVRPRDAATVALLRDSPGGLEVYTLRRVRTMAFGAGMHVFPGGSVDPRDEEVSIGWVGPEPAYWAEVLTASEALARALVCAAVRETFEESGVLLAGPDGDSVVADTGTDEWESDRRALVNRDLSFADLLARRGLALRADLLRPWAHWITPLVEPKRFDTRFFVAAMPGGQRTREFGEEADEVEWLAPSLAIARWQDGVMRMMPPTLITVAELAEFSRVAEVLAGRRMIHPIEPQIVVDGEHADLVLPGDPGYRAAPGDPTTRRDDPSLPTGSSPG